MVRSQTVFIVITLSLKTKLHEAIHFGSIQVEKHQCISHGLRCSLFLTVNKVTVCVGTQTEADDKLDYEQISSVRAKHQPPRSLRECISILNSDVSDHMNQSRTFSP